MSTDITPAAPAADLNEADAAALFGTMADAKFDPAEDPAVVPTDDHEDDAPAAPVAAVEEVPATTPAPAAPASAPAATDIWSNATPELRAAHEAALAERDQRYRSDIGRQAAYQRTIQDLRDQIAGKNATPAAAPAAEAPPPVALRERPGVKEALEGYPEVVAPILDAIEPVMADNARMSRELSTLSDDRRAGVVAAQEQALTAAHPDWQQACASKDFADWLEVQPAAIKQIVARNGEHVVDAEEAIAMVGSFKAHWALTHPAPVPQPPVVPTPAAPTNLAERRAAQLAAVTSAPKGAPAAIPDGAPGGSEAALFDHFVKKKALKG